MTERERGFLLLTSQLGNPERKPLTQPQLRDLAGRIQGRKAREPSRELEISDLTALGCGSTMASRIVSLLEEEALLDHYLGKADRMGIVPITRVTDSYPLILRKRLGLEAPGCLWARGDLSLLKKPAVSLVGSRELREDNRTFAEAAGREIARQGLALVSGNARGADRTAQNACLEAGGAVISVVADALTKHTPRENILYLSEFGYDEEFSAHRALRRNRVIHALGRITLVAQSDLGKGGTWDGTIRNLHHGLSPVACFRDGSEASRELEQRGAHLIGMEDLEDLCGFRAETTLFDL